LKQSVKNAGPVFLQKVQTEAQLGTWQSNTRISSQLTELIAAVRAMREELRLMRLQKSTSNPLNILVRGSEIQNEKNRRLK
ncbi:MAG: hypothetical protein D6797_09690, partial [Bdellovibrio sp.]